MPTTFANTIDGNDIFAKRAECDAAGNDLSTTYATKSELPDGVPAVTSSDDNKVLKASYSGGTGSYSWQTESGGSDAVYVTWDNTQAGWDTMWAQVQAALSGNKDVFLKDGFCVAELVATNPTQVNFRGLANSTGVPPKITYNYYYLQSGFAHKDVQDQYVLPYPGSGSTGQLLGLVSSDDPPYREPGWVTVSPGPTYSAGTGIDITNNVISADTTVLATKSELPDGVPAVTSSDNNKVLKASYSGGVASYSWQNESGGGGGGSYTAGTGIDITNDVISVDTSVVATQADLADKEDAFAVGTGLEMDTSGATPTLQVEAPVDIVAGPGIVIDNPDGNTLRVSVAHLGDWEDVTSEITKNTTIITGGSITFRYNKAMKMISLIGEIHVQGEGNVYTLPEKYRPQTNFTCSNPGATSYIDYTPSNGKFVARSGANGYFSWTMTMPCLGE